ncbi:hypothetical protein LCGC14_2500590, partial [marine sediment metagenome]
YINARIVAEKNFRKGDVFSTKMNIVGMRDLRTW